MLKRVAFADLPPDQQAKFGPLIEAVKRGNVCDQMIEKLSGGERREEAPEPAALREFREPEPAAAEGAPSLESLLALSQWESVRLPDGTKAWVSAWMPEDHRLLMEWGQVIDIRIDPRAPAAVREPKEKAAGALSLAVQVAVAAYRSPERRDDNRCFVRNPADLKEVRRAVGTIATHLPLGVAQDICAQTERLAGLRAVPEEAVRQYFFGIAESLSELHSAWESWGSCPPGSLETLSALISQCRRTSLLGKPPWGEG